MVQIKRILNIDEDEAEKYFQKRKTATLRCKEISDSYPNEPVVYEKVSREEKYGLTKKS
jgi:hypothetical protein